MADRSIWCEASKLRSNPKVAQWLRHFQRIGLDAARLTIERHLAELVRARELAIAHGQISAAVQAEHHRGKAAGLYEDRFRIASEPSDAELIRLAEETLGEDIAKAIGAALGYSSNEKAGWRLEHDPRRVAGGAPNAQGSRCPLLTDGKGRVGYRRAVLSGRSS
jgi:hypothetical protein